MSAPPTERGREGGRVEDVGVDGAGAEALEQAPAAQGPGDAADVVAGGMQFADRPAAEDAGGSGDHDVVHDPMTTHLAGS